jgi:hypothetical protein
MKDIKKKIVCILIAAVLITIVSGCGADRDGGSENKPANSEAGSQTANEGLTDEEKVKELIDKAKGEQHDPGNYPKVFEGVIDIKENAGGGSISFSMSDDGKKLTNVQVTFSDIMCNSVSGDTLRQLQMAEQGITLNGIYEIKDNAFTIKLDEMELIGQLIDNTKAEGTIHYIVEVSSSSTDREKYDLGTWDWSAEIKQ